MKLRKNPNKKLIQAVNKFYPWDYGYLLDIEKAALKEMLKYFDSEHCMVDRSQIVPYIKLAIKMLDIVDMTDDPCNRTPDGEWILPSYINTKNWTRFFKKDSFVEKNWCYNELRKEKAWHLYHLIRLRYMRYFWD